MMSTKGLVIGDFNNWRDEMKYKVSLKFMYSDIVHVEANSEREAEQLALEECQEEYESFYDSEITEE